MAAAGVLVAADEHLVRGLEEQDADARARLPELVERGRAARRGRRRCRRPAPPARWWSPGACTSSATLAMSVGGRLSMTNQPRSSNVSDACERPAPESPVMMRNSLTPRLRIPTALPPSRHAGTAGGESSAASWYSAARARKPGGGGGSSMRVTSRPAAIIAFTYRDSGRWMNGMKTPLSTSSSEASSMQVGADAPVLLGRVEHLVVDPARAGRLQQRVVHEEQEAAARGAGPGPPPRWRRPSTRCARTRGTRPPRRSARSGKGSASARRRARRPALPPARPRP